MSTSRAAITVTEGDKLSATTAAVATAEDKSENISLHPVSAALVETPPLHPLKPGRPKSVNSFAAQKTMVNGLFDLALLTANASQIKLVATQGSDAPHYYVLITLLVFSVMLQLTTAVLLLLMGTENLDKLADGRHETKRKLYWKLNVSATILVFFITVINVFVAAFGLPLGKEALGQLM